jgi:hypothetical protein
MFYFNEGSLDIDNEWQDRSIILLSHPSNLSISVARETMPLGMNFKEYAQKQLEQISQQLRDYTETNQTNIEVDGYETVLTEYMWFSPQGKMYQMSAIINLPIHPTIITTSSLSELTEGQRSYLLGLIQSFKARQ